MHVDRFFARTRFQVGAKSVRQILGSVMTRTVPAEVLVQILLSVCICLARSFVDSSGQDRGPNFRSGGCLSG